jgi:uncharacterized phage protein gp47/JayE
MAENPTFDFSSRDYANIRRDLLTRATRTIPEWTDRDPADFATALIDLWAYTADILHFYIDRSAQEAFLTSATRRESVLSLANLFDYTPRFITPASGVIYITNSSSASVTLPAYTTFTGVSGDTLYQFYTEQEETIAGNVTAGVTAVEGAYYSEQPLTTSASGQIGQRYTIPFTNVDPSSVRVFVTEGTNDETEWPRVNNVNTIPSNTAGFSVYVDSSQNVEVVFGNRFSGKIPPVGSTIKASFATCSGSQGNVPANTVRTFTSSIPQALAVGTSSAFTGGSDIESIESMKRSIKATVRTQQRAVTLQDFADYANLTAGVYRAVASYSASASVVTLHVMPYISNYSTVGGASVPTPAAMQTELVSTIQPLALLGVTVAAAPQVYLCAVNISANIYVKPNYVATAVQAEVANAINGLFALDQLDFGKELRIGDIYRTVLSNPGVDYVELSTFQIIDPNNGNAVVTNFAANHPTKFLRKGTVTLTTFGGITTS